MEILEIKIKKDSAYSLLENLEKLDVLEIVKKKTNSKPKLSELLKAFTKEDGLALEKHIKESRESWNRTF